MALLGNLCLRGTFIDIEDERDAATDESVQRRLSRSRTLPVERMNSETSSLFDDESVYIADLSEKLGSLWGSEASPEQRCTDMRSFFDQAAGVMRGEASFSPLASVEPHIAHSNESMSELVLRTKATTDESAVGVDAATTDDCETPAPSLLLGDAATANNQGSLGHPQLCSRPCLYFASGQCQNGTACDFCHLSHAKRPAHLDKKHRETLRAMSKARARGLLLPVLREKVAAFDGSPETMLAMDHLAKVCGATRANGDAAAPRTRSERAVVGALAATSLRVVLTSLQNSALGEDSTVREAAEALGREMRSRSRAAIDVEAAMVGNA